MPMPDKVAQLIKRFEERRAEYESPQYSEAQLRIDFLNPLFESLGWDVTNTAGLGPLDREVITEPRQRAEDGSIEFPDYLFQASGRQIFAVEAKKPSVNLKDSPGPALQLRRYAWNSKTLGVGILTDFQEFGIYDCAKPPEANDKASKARVDYYTFDEYEEHWADIEGRFSREAVLAGALDEYVSTFAGTRGKQRVDKLFLAELEDWRKELAIGLAKRNNLSQDELNFATQVILDRIVFLRICEDRGTENYGQIRDCTRSPGTYQALLSRFIRADEKYNSGLFHFRPEKNRRAPDDLTPNLTVPDRLLNDFIKRLYWPDGPYDFAVLPPDVLGHVYEQFLGKVIHLKSATQAVVEDKPEVRKAGGVFYTPTQIVKDIVRAVLSEALKSHTPTTLAKKGLLICDPSCGSGSFLIEVYQYLLDWYESFYIHDDTTKWSRTRPKRLQRDVSGAWSLTSAERKRILTSHVFGVDIDAQAVEVTKLALLLKLLEGETASTLHEQTELFHERVLPDLDANIKCGNSLVGNALYFSAQATLDDDLERKVNAFDWPVEFNHVAAGRGFDVIVGNPPWLMAGYYVAESVEYMKHNFVTATGKFDLYYLFLEQSLRLLAPGGTLGMIVPNKFFHTTAAKALRELLATKADVTTVKDFGVARVFEAATNYSCILIAKQQRPAGNVSFERVTAELVVTEQFRVSRDALGVASWSFQDDVAKAVFAKMRAAGTSLESLVERFGTGVQTGADSLLTFTADEVRRLKLERNLLQPLLRGRDVRAFRLSSRPKLLLFPYSVLTGEHELLSEPDLKNNPKAWDYLRENKPRLATRIWFGKDAAALSGGWYGLMYVESHSTVSKPHLLTPSLSSRSNFARGSGALFATGTAGVTAVVPKLTMPESTEYLLAVLNSDAVSVYVTRHSPVYQGGFHKFSAPYLKGIPIPRLDMTKAEGRSTDKRIAQLVIEVETSAAALEVAVKEAERERLRRRVGAAKQGINREINRLYGFDLDEAKWLAQVAGE